MKIRWTEEAAVDLEQIGLYVAEDNLQAALRTVNTIYERIEQLCDFPYRGRIGREPGTRELVLAPSPYIVVYRVVEFTIEILHIVHGAQNRP